MTMSRPSLDELNEILTILDPGTFRSLFLCFFPFAYRRMAIIVTAGRHMGDKPALIASKRKAPEAVFDIHGVYRAPRLKEMPRLWSLFVPASAPIPH